MRQVMDQETGPIALSQLRGASYHDTIQLSLAEERSTKASLEQRGVTIVTTSGVLATLLFGFGAFVYGPKAPSITDEGIGLLITSVVLFVVAAACGLAANRPAVYLEARIENLRKRTEPAEWFARDGAEGARRDAQFAIAVIDTYRTANATKARSVYVGTCFETLAVSSVASSLMAILGGTRAFTEVLAIVFLAGSFVVLSIGLLRLVPWLRNRARGGTSVSDAGDDSR